MAEAVPKDLKPMLATPAKQPPPGAEWAHEIKWDGVRALAFVEGGEARIRARRGEDVSARYPELAGLGKALGGHDAVLDGEIVAFDEEGRPSFQLLQPRVGLTDPGRVRRRAAQAPVTYVAFDLLWLDGRSLLGEPYEERREALAALVGEAGGEHPCLLVPTHHVGDAAALWELVRERRLEGIVSKRLGSPYRPGARSRAWIKVRNRLGQELVIGGWMPGEGARAGVVGSLLVGHWDCLPAEAERLGRRQRLVYAGGVGTGFSDRMLAELTALLEPLRREEMPFELGEDPRLKYRQRSRERGAGPVWVEPSLICEVEFSEWTREGTLRQPAFKGLRDDKDPREVVREG